MKIQVTWQIVKMCKVAFKLLVTKAKVYQQDAA